MHSGLAFSAWPSRLTFDDVSIDLSPNLVHPDVMPCYEDGSNASPPYSPAKPFHYHCLINRRSRSRRNQILNYFHPQGEICDKCSTLRTVRTTYQYQAMGDLQWHLTFRAFLALPFIVDNILAPSYVSSGCNIFIGVGSVLPSEPQESRRMAMRRVTSSLRSNSS